MHLYFVCLYFMHVLRDLPVLCFWLQVCVFYKCVPVLCLLSFTQSCGMQFQMQVWQSLQESSCTEWAVLPITSFQNRETVTAIAIFVKHNNYLITNEKIMLNFVNSSIHWVAFDFVIQGLGFEVSERYSQRWIHLYICWPTAHRHWC